MEKKCWYKEMAVYQIWCRSFCDGNGDGIGDLWGVLSKLDYIASLNVDGIWFSPLYPSPNADYGYDISDYKNIHPDFGNLEVFKQVLDGAHERAAGGRYDERDLGHPALADAGAGAGLRAMDGDAWLCGGFRDRLERR